jgi:DNA-binding transcriptional MerR regulator
MRSGCFVPTEIDPHTGYRYYTEEQIPTAELIRRLRALQTPVDDVEVVMSAPDADARNRVIVAHLGRLEGELARTSAASAELRRLLERPSAPERAERRTVRETQAGAIRQVVDRDDISTGGRVPWESFARSPSPRTSNIDLAYGELGAYVMVTRSASTGRCASITGLNYSTRAKLTSGRLRSDGRSFGLTLEAEPRPSRWALLVNKVSLATSTPVVVVIAPKRTALSPSSPQRTLARSGVRLRRTVARALSARSAP